MINIKITLLQYSTLAIKIFTAFNLSKNVNFNLWEADDQVFNNADDDLWNNVETLGMEDLFNEQHIDDT